MGSQKKRRVSSELFGADDTDAADLCFLCQSGGDLPKVWRGIKLHGPCWNGVRCYIRCLGSEKAKKEEQKKFAEEPDVWRSEVDPLVVRDGGQRSARIRKDLKRKSAYDDKYEDKEHITDFCCSRKRSTSSTCPRRMARTLS